MIIISSYMPIHHVFLSWSNFYHNAYTFSDWISVVAIYLMPYNPFIHSFIQSLFKMAEHADLVSEMTVVEKMSTQERLKHARKRRLQQLKRWSQREKEYQQTKRKKSTPNANDPSKSNKPNKTYKVHFVPSVMLLEAAARNDVEEGKLPLYFFFF